MDQHGPDDATSPAPAATGRRRPRLDDVAARVGVSPATVSLVLRGAAGPSAATRDRVMAAAASLGYRADRSASLLARRRTHLIGATLHLTSSYHAALVADLHAAADRVGYDVVLSAVTPSRDERRAVETLVDSRCEALVLLAPASPAPWLAGLGRDVPTVVVGRRVSADGVDVVRSADDRGIAAAVDHLVGLGHRDIAYVDGPRGTIATDRRAGYRRAMRRHGLSGRVRVLAGADTEGAGVEAAGAMLALDPRPTAVVAYNDAVAVGVLDALLRAGVPVPGALSVVGYDDSPAARLPLVDLTSVDQDAPHQAEHAVSAALERLDGGRTDRREVVLPPRLVVRGSTGPVPGSSHGGVTAAG